MTPLEKELLDALKAIDEKLNMIFLWSSGTAPNDRINIRNGINDIRNIVWSKTESQSIPKFTVGSKTTYSQERKLYIQPQSTSLPEGVMTAAKLYAFLDAMRDEEGDILDIRAAIDLIEQRDAQILAKPLVTDDAMNEQELVKFVCRQIYSYTEFNTDESWERAWTRYTDPYGTKMGGPWSALGLADKIINTVRATPVTVTDDVIERAAKAVNHTWGEIAQINMEIDGQCHLPSGGTCIAIAKAALSAAYPNPKGGA